MADYLIMAALLLIASILASIADSLIEIKQEIKRRKSWPPSKN